MLQKHLSYLTFFRRFFNHSQLALLVTYYYCIGYLIRIFREHKVFFKASCYGAWTVIQAFFLTTIIVVCLTIYTLQTKRDFSSMGALLFSGLILVITGGFLQVKEKFFFEFSDMN